MTKENRGGQSFHLPAAWNILCLGVASFKKLNLLDNRSYFCTANKYIPPTALFGTPKK